MSDQAIDLPRTLPPFDQSDEDTDPQLKPREPLEPVDLVQTELRLLRSAYEAQGLALGELQRNLHRLEMQVADNALVEQGRFDSLSGDLGEIKKALERLLKPST